jgi:hypothetical protein
MPSSIGMSSRMNGGCDAMMVIRGYGRLILPSTS